MYLYLLLNKIYKKKKSGILSYNCTLGKLKPKEVEEGRKEVRREERRKERRKEGMGLSDADDNACSNWRAMALIF